MELPQPPQDQELKNIIDKLAQFVARNGPEFEQMTKTKQKDNPKFSFLFGGDFFNYYQYKVTTEQAILKHRQSREQNIMIHPSQMVSQSQPPMAAYPTQSSAGGFNSSSYPFPYPNASGYGGGGDGQQYPPGVVMNNYHQPHPYQMGPPGNDGQMQIGAGPPNSASGPGFHPPFPANDPSFGSSFPNQSSNPEDHYSQPHGSFPANQPPIMAPGTEHTAPSNANGFQQPPLPPPPPPSTSCDPGPSPVPSIGSSSMASSGQIPPQEVQTSLENVNYEIHQLKEQIKQSELNLSAQRQVLEQQNEIHIREGVYVAKGEQLRKEAADLGLNIQEFEDLLTPITESCTKDSISNGKQWIFTRAVTPQVNSWISLYLLYKSTCISGPFTHKLHIIYLMNDVLHHCLRKNADDLKESLEKVLSPMYCHAVSCASEDQKAKLDKLLALWESKMHLDDNLLNQLHSPIESWNSYEKEKLSEFPQVVTTVSQHMNATLEGYQQQHNAFVQHATSQIQQLEQQKHHLEQQKHHLEQQQSQQSQQQSQQPQQQQQPPPPPPPQPQQRPGVGVIQGPPPPPGNFVQMSSHGQHPPHQFMPPHVQGGPHQPGMNQGMDFNQPPPGFHTGSVPVIDFSKPPPGFPSDDSKENLIPSVPYFELPAGLMTPLIKPEDSKYKPIDPSMIRLPVPTPPSERLLCAVENFYQPPSHDRPRNCEGWEQLALYDYYKAKSTAIKEKERLVQENQREKSRSPSPIAMEVVPEEDEPKPLRPVRRYRSVSPELKEEPREIRSKSVSDENRKVNYRRSPSRSPPHSPQRFRPQRSPSKSPPQRSRSRSHSASRSPSNSHSRSHSRSRSRSRTRSRTRSHSRSHSRSRSKSPLRMPFRKSRSRSLTPPSFGLQSFPRSEGIDESNKGHQMLRSMGWSGSGLGVKEQGMAFPISAGEVRETPQERFRGLGVPTPQSDPYEAFRKNKGQAFINRMKARAEEKY